MLCGNGYEITRWSPEIERAPAFRGLFVKLWLGNRSDSIDVLGLQTLGTLLDLEFHLRAFVQRTVAVRLDSRKVHKHVIAGGSLDKSVSLGGVKPLNNTFFFHLRSPDSLFARRDRLPNAQKATKGFLRSSYKTLGRHEQPFTKTSRIIPDDAAPVKRVYNPKPNHEKGFHPLRLSPEG